MKVSYYCAWDLTDREGIDITVVALAVGEQHGHGPDYRHKDYVRLDSSPDFVAIHSPSTLLLCSFRNAIVALAQ